MIILFLSMFFKCVSTLLEFAVNIIMAMVQFLFTLITTTIKESIRLSKERKAKEKAENKKFKTTTESEIPQDGKFVLLELVESEWHPIGYYATYMEAYTAKLAKRAIPKAPPMIIQEIK